MKKMFNVTWKINPLTNLNTENHIEGTKLCKILLCNSSSALCECEVTDFMLTIKSELKAKAKVKTKVCNSLSETFSGLSFLILKCSVFQSVGMSLTEAASLIFFGLWLETKNTNQQQQKKIAVFLTTNKVNKGVRNVTWS